MGITNWVWVHGSSTGGRSSSPKREQDSEITEWVDMEVNRFVRKEIPTVIDGQTEGILIADPLHLQQLCSL